MRKGYFFFSIVLLGGFEGDVFSQPSLSPSLGHFSNIPSYFFVDFFTWWSWAHLSSSDSKFTVLPSTGYPCSDRPDFQFPQPSVVTNQENGNLECVTLFLRVQEFASCPTTLSKRKKTFKYLPQKTHGWMKLESDQ